MEGLADDSSFLELDAFDGFTGLPHYWISAAEEDWNAALADARSAAAWLDANKARHGVLGLLQPVWILPLEALAAAKTGDIAAAEELISRTPLDCYLCVRVRGQIAAEKKDWPTAEGWFAEAVRQAPTPPFAYTEWGQMRLAKGDVAGAIAVFKTAHEKGPRFADPLKGWGEALARQGSWSEARGRFNEALTDAPAWPALREARDDAVAHLR
jgi:tetratricopeptide (TPR) repeat protein